MGKNRISEYQVTIHDVAREAGVSPATVSRVMNDAENVSEEARRRVLTAVDTLGYKRRKTDTHLADRQQIALVITDILNPFFPEIIRGIEDEIDARQTDLILHNTSEDAAKEQEIFRTLAESNPSGVIVSASRVSSEDLIRLNSQYALPIVVINRQIRQQGIPSITIDFADATFRATQHLLSLNHRRISFLRRHTESETSLARRHGIERALSAFDATLSDALCPPAYPNIEGGFQAMSGLLALPQHERPTAVIAYNDLMALGALNAVRNYGLRVPEDISVVGFDDITIAAHSNPPLTTINQPKYRIGQLAVQLLRQVIAHRRIANEYILVESPLIVRQSTARATE